MGWGRTVLYVEFDARAGGGAREPEVEVGALAGIEEEDAGAVVELGDFVEVAERGLRVEFGVFSGVREHGEEVVEEVAVAVGYAPGAED